MASLSRVRNQLFEVDFGTILGAVALRNIFTGIIGSIAYALLSAH